MTRLDFQCRVGKPDPSPVVHTHEFAGSYPASATISAHPGGASSSRSAGDAAGWPPGKPDAVQPPPAPRPETVSIHITTDAAALLAVLAADQGESPGSMVARLVAEDIERKGGIAHV